MAENRSDDIWSEDGGMILIDKPVGLTSFDVIYRLRRWCGVAKAGHAGTLDPNASGLLIVCVGKQTKQIGQFAALDKEYVGTMELGIRTPSFDTETEVSERHDASAITEELVRSAMEKFVGPQLQQPPMYSAVKHRGQPLYKFARKGAVLHREAREIMVTEFTLTSSDLPSVGFRVECSKGTYIRSLVDDLGQMLGCGAVLTSLRRTCIGPYRVEDAVSIEAMEERWKQRRSRQHHDHGYRIPA